MDEVSELVADDDIGGGLPKTLLVRLFFMTRALSCSETVLSIFFALSDEFVGPSHDLSATHLSRKFKHGLLLHDLLLFLILLCLIINSCFFYFYFYFILQYIQNYMLVDYLTFRYWM